MVRIRISCIIQMQLPSFFGQFELLDHRYARSLFPQLPNEHQKMYENITNYSKKHRFVLVAIGTILIATGAANLHALLDLGVDESWSFLALTEGELFGGLWLICGLSLKWTRILGVSFFTVLMAYDLSLFLRDQPPRLGFGRIQVSSWVNLGSDITFGLSLMYLLPTQGRSAWLDSHPRRVLMIGILSVVVGVMIDRERFGQYPGIGMTAPRDPGGSLGLRYLLYLPEGYHYPGQHWPLVVFLHGSSAVGHDLEKVKLEGLARSAEKKRNSSFVLVAPQSPSSGWNPAAVNALVDQILARYRVDPDRVYLTGLSMGGYGTWALASAYPERFAAIAPVCGGGDRAMAGPLRSMPTWVFHGARDDIVPLAESEKMVEALKELQGNVMFTVYPDAGHDSWSATYDAPEFYAWLLAQKRRSVPPTLDLRRRLN